MPHDVIVSICVVLTLGLFAGLSIYQVCIKFDAENELVEKYTSLSGHTLLTYRNKRTGKYWDMLK
ncbi:MAG TPA: hypothetical protein VLH56_18730 [Dissulfurispiraceae bacterium]|nr:hypothetical protein [Dissulfurispiraceae bacterium]